MKLIGIGRLGRDPETRYTASGKAITSFSIAFDEGYGESKHTVWLRCNAWEKRGEIIGQHFKKGDRIYIEGRLDIREWEKDGEKRLSTECQVENFEFIEKKGSSEPRADVQRVPRQQSLPDSGGVDFLEDDIPF